MSTCSRRDHDHDDTEDILLIAPADIPDQPASPSTLLKPQKSDAPSASFHRRNNSTGGGTSFKANVGSIGTGANDDSNLPKSSFLHITPSSSEHRPSMTSPINVPSNIQYLPQTTPLAGHPIESHAASDLNLVTPHNTGDKNPPKISHSPAINQTNINPAGSPSELHSPPPFVQDDTFIDQYMMKSQQPVNTSFGNFSDFANKHHALNQSIAITNDSTYATTIPGSIPAAELMTNQQFLSHEREAVFQQKHIPPATSCDLVETPNELRQRGPKAGMSSPAKSNTQSSCCSEAEPSQDELDQTDTLSLNSYAPSLPQSLANSYATTILSIRQFGKRFIGSVQHAERFMHIAFIKTGYRLNHSSIKDCVQSLFQLHNETCNVYTHILGFCVFIFLLIWRYFTVLRYLEDSLLFWCYILFYLGSATCLVLSTIYHLFSCIDKHTHDQLYRFDMLGILIMVLTNLFPPLLVSFYCDSSGAGTVYATIMLILGFFLILIQSLDYFHRPEWYVFRISSIIGYCALVVFPGYHFYTAIGFDKHIAVVIPTMIFTLSWYALGVVIWIVKFPECFLQNTFDLGLYSHGLWHCCIIIASLVQERGFQQAVIEIVDKTWCTA